MEEIKVYCLNEKILHRIIRYSGKIIGYAGIITQPENGTIISFDEEGNVEEIHSYKNYKMNSFNILKRHFRSGKSCFFYKNGNKFGEEISFFNPLHKKWKKNAINKIAKDVLNEGKDFS